MITGIILTIFYSFVNLLFALLPSGHLPTQISSAFAYFMGVVNSFSFVVPVDTLIQAALVVLAFDGAMLVWYFVNWIIRKVPGMH
jgi:putative flippase GtrA